MTYDDASLREELKRRIAEANLTPAAWAKQHGLVDETVHSFLRGARPAGFKLAKVMGVKRKMTYEDA